MPKVWPSRERRPRRYEEAPEQEPLPVRSQFRSTSTAIALMLAVGLGFWIISAKRDAEEIRGTAVVTDCDRLAAHPSDTQKLTAGVAQEGVDIPAAKAACEEALRQRPGDGRLLYQWGRAYFYNDEKSRGIEIFRQSSAAGYPQGQFVLGLIFATGDGIDADMCEAGRLWVRAARQRHLYSKIYLGQNWLDGSLKGCKLDLTEAELDGMITAAADLADTDRQRDDLAQLRDNWARRSTP